MAKESVHKKLERVRPPRVHVTYDVEVGDAIEQKELPFVLGVMGDFSGQPVDPLPRLKERRFVEVTPDNFDSVLESMRPHLSFAVENKLSDDPNAGQLKVDLHFKSMDDFEPDQVARQVKPLRELLDLRTKLNDLKGALQTNEKLDELLLEAVSNTEKLEKLKSEIGQGMEKPQEGGSNGRGGKSGSRFHGCGKNGRAWVARSNCGGRAAGHRCRHSGTRQRPGEGIPHAGSGR